ncbi:MAG: electron transfer flavoprotein alpha/ beta subunit [Chloroflexi bacterium]|nr:electron transfer flavoprotein alpha/ beta subunit [Chloroflexota bacterium]
MKTAVCMKYVPIIARIQFDYEAKTIIRDGVPSEVNPFDLLGLVRAVELKRSPEDEVVVISMGPPGASEGLTDCVALGADRAVLVTDRALAGSDTLATSRALSLALLREKPDLIICGRNSTDGETGQVGPEIAELMGLPHVSHVRKLDLSDDGKSVIAERMTDEGFQTLECGLPALICVTEGVAPELYPNKEQMERAQEIPVEEMTCADLLADRPPGLSGDLTQFGAAGSPTWVDEIRLVEPNRLGVLLEDVTPEDAAKQVADALRQRLAELAAADSVGSGKSAAAAMPRFPNSREKSIWVVAENTRQGLAHVTLEMLGKARELTQFTKSEVVAVLIGPQQDARVAELASQGADRVLVLDNSQIGPVYGRAVGQALAEAVQKEPPYAVLFASTADGRDLASRLAARLELGLTGDAIDLEIDAEGRLVQLKPALGGNVIAPILSKTLPNLVTLRPGLLTPVTPEPGATVTVEQLPAVPFDGPDVRLLHEEFQEDQVGLILAKAPVVLGVGMGIGGVENLAKIQEMARSIGASIATTRDVAHEGWLPQQLQVGISGRTIAPTVYLAVGIRGAFNHTVGLQRAGVIISVNQNRRAVMFRSSDFGIVGTWEEFLPPLIEQLRPILLELNSAPMKT